MERGTDPKDKKPEEGQQQERTPEEIKQMKSDPNLTELKGLTDPDEPLEPKDNDNPFNE